MSCCEKDGGNCTTCAYSIDGDIKCYSPNLDCFPAIDAEYVPRSSTIEPTTKEKLSKQ